MTDDDRKLLEAAARAAGIVLFAYTTRRAIVRSAASMAPKEGL